MSAETATESERDALERLAETQLGWEKRRTVMSTMDALRKALRSGGVPLPAAPAAPAAPGELTGATAGDFSPVGSPRAPPVTPVAAGHLSSLVGYVRQLELGQAKLQLQSPEPVGAEVATSLPALAATLPGEIRHLRERVKIQEGLLADLQADRDFDESDQQVFQQSLARTQAELRARLGSLTQLHADFQAHTQRRSLKINQMLARNAVDTDLAQLWQAKQGEQDRQLRVLAALVAEHAGAFSDRGRAEDF